MKHIRGRALAEKLLVFVVTVLFYGTIFFIAYSGRGEQYFSFLDYVPGRDKTAHAVLLCVLSVAICWMLSFRGVRIRGRKIHFGVILVLALITIDEFLQAAVPHRTFDWIDLVCNWLGILVAFIAVRFYEKRKESVKALTKEDE